MKTKTFDPQMFITQVLKAMKLDDESPKAIAELSDAINMRLTNRIIATITSNLEDSDMEKLFVLMDENPEMDSFDALTLIAEKVPGMDQHLIKAVNDLYEELTEDARQIDDALKFRKQNEEAAQMPTL